MTPKGSHTKTTTERPHMMMAAQTEPAGWEYVQSLHGMSDPVWFLEFHQTKNRGVWTEATGGREWKLVLAEEVGMQWFDDEGRVIPQSEYWAKTVYVLIRRTSVEPKA